MFSPVRPVVFIYIATRLAIILSLPFLTTKICLGRNSAKDLQYAFPLSRPRWVFFISVNFRCVMLNDFQHLLYFLRNLFKISLFQTTSVSIKLYNILVYVLFILIHQYRSIKMKSNYKFKVFFFFK